MTDSSEQLNLIREYGGEYYLTTEQKAEKETYRTRLRAFLEDPASQKIEGFPIGDNDAIMGLSDPPYYTACPNPFLNEIITKWQKEREGLNAKQSSEGQKYHCEPFAADVSEGKNDPIYNAHSYHTKVPHKAIMRYILHYTQPGDIILDGFCGTGMTGVAAQLCGERKVIENLGYSLEGREDRVMDETGNFISHLGARKAVLVDLSPAATFIAYNYNTPVDANHFEQEANRILKEVEKECGWMFETLHTDRRTKGKINFTVWSDVYICTGCGEEVVFWDVAIDHKNNNIRDEWKCSRCGALLSKSPPKDSAALRAERVFETTLDRSLNKTLRQAKQVPVLINYSVSKKHFEKRPDPDDLELIRKINESDIPYSFPINELPDGFNTQQPRISHGLCNVHHFYTRRNLWILAAIHARIRGNAALLLLFNSQLVNLSKLNRYRPDVSFPYNPLSGTLYVASQVSEANPFTAYKNKVFRLVRAFVMKAKNAVTFAGSASQIDLQKNSISSSRKGLNMVYLALIEGNQEPCPSPQTRLLEEFDLSKC